MSTKSLACVKKDGLWQTEHPACKKSTPFYRLHTHTRLTALFPRLPGWVCTRKVKPIWFFLLKQETVSGSGISWAICKSALCSRKITTPAPHHSVFLQTGCPFCQRPTASKHWRHMKAWMHSRLFYRLMGNWEWNDNNELLIDGRACQTWCHVVVVVVNRCLWIIPTRATSSSRQTIRIVVVICRVETITVETVARVNRLLGNQSARVSWRWCLTYTHKTFIASTVLRTRHKYEAQVVTRLHST